MSLSPLIRQLIDDLRCLPGVGPKSAQRMAFQLLQRDRQGARRLAETLRRAVDEVGHCQRCRTLSEHPICELCQSTRRNPQLLCVVETPSDVQAIEQSGVFNGYYFVLMGHLSPLDGIGPSDIGLDKLSARLDEGEISEVILATNPTVEGEATAHYISEMVRARAIRATRIASGVPLGSALEYTDSETLSRALDGRKEL